MDSEGSEEDTESEVSSDAERGLHGSDRSRSSLESQRDSKVQQDQPVSADHNQKTKGSQVTVQLVPTGNVGVIQLDSPGEVPSEARVDTTFSPTSGTSLPVPAVSVVQDGTASVQTIPHVSNGSTSLPACTAPASTVVEPVVQSNTQTTVEPPKDSTHATMRPQCQLLQLPCLLNKFFQFPSPGVLMSLTSTLQSTSAASSPIEEEPNPQGSQEAPLIIDAIPKRGLMRIPIRGQDCGLECPGRRRIIFQITRDQTITELKGLGISHEELLGIGESGTGEWDVYCCPQATAERLHAIGGFYYSSQHGTEMYLLCRQLCTIRVHWLLWESTMTISMIRSRISVIRLKVSPMKLAAAPRLQAFWQVSGSFIASWGTSSKKRQLWYVSDGLW